MDSKRVTRREALGLAAVAGAAMYWPRAAKAADGWPLARPDIEADTLFLLDTAIEKTLAPGKGGLIPQPGASWAEAPGKFRPGIRTSGGYVWMPMVGMLAANEFTFEAWLDADWGTLTDCPILAIHEPDQGLGLELSVPRAQDGLQVRFGHNQDPAGPVNVMLSHPLPSSGPLGVAVTFKDGTLRLIANGETSEKTGIPAPRLWADEMRSEGLCIGGFNGKAGQPVTVSDLRVSALARTAGASPPTFGTVVTVDATPTGRPISRHLTGGLQLWPSLTDEPYPLFDKGLAGVVTTVRTGKWLQVTPIKAGAPDATHPTAGKSGAFSYDWQIVDRAIAHCKRLGLQLYLNLDSCPSILGGKTGPYQGDDLLHRAAHAAAYNGEVPNDTTAWGQMCEDLVHYVTVTQGLPVPRWGVGNEPEGGGGYWAGSKDQWIAYYTAAANAVKRVDPALKVGGPECAHWNDDWIESLIASKAPVDFIAWHSYMSDIAATYTARAKVTRWATQYGRGPVEVFSTEWAQGGHEFPSVGMAPWNQVEMFRNDWGGAWNAAMLQTFQAIGAPLAIFTSPAPVAYTTGWDATSLVDTAAKPYATGNTFRLWNRLGPTELPASVNRPGVFATAATSDTGTQVLLTRLSYRKDPPLDVTVKLPAALAGKAVTCHVIDDQHSNMWDAGAAHMDLETMAVSAVGADGTVAVHLAARSVHLLEIA